MAPGPTDTAINALLSGQHDDPILCPPPAAEYLAISASRLAKLRVTGGGPTFLKLGRSVRYRKSDLDAWLSARTRRSTSDIALTMAK